MKSKRKKSKIVPFRSLQLTLENQSRNNNPIYQMNTLRRNRVILIYYQLKIVVSRNKQKKIKNKYKISKKILKRRKKNKRLNQRSLKKNNKMKKNLRMML